MTIEKKLLGTTPVASGDSPEAVSFDGSGDHLKRTSDLTSNANGKTFTFSAWVYRAKDSQANILDNNTAGVLVQMDSQGSVGFRFMNAGTSAGINHTSGKAIPLNTWTHICMSADLNVSGSAKIFFNDVQDTQSISQSNTNISFSTGIHYIGGEDGTGSFMNGRLAHVFLDYRYRDLTIEANRRFFITSDGKPAENQDSVDTASTDYLHVGGKGSGYLAGMCFNNDGTRLLISEGGTDDIFQYNLSTGFDLSTATYAGYNINGSGHGNYIQDVQFKDNGTKVYFGGNGGSNSIHQYNLTTANDISTASEFGSKAVSSVVGAERLFITDDGSKMYVASNYTIARWNLSTNFNITTASHVNTKILPYKIASIQFNADGTEMYLAEAVRDAMVTYTLTTAYDPTTAVLKHYKFLNYMDTTLTEAIFNSDGSKLYVLGDNTNRIYEMLVSTPFDARTAVYGALQGSPAAPIMYLPMKDAATAGSNSGTGGDFTAIGVLATAERGPNQDNCSASVFDGSNDFLDDDNDGSGSTSYPSTSTATVSFFFKSNNNADGLISTNGNFITVNKGSPQRLEAECGKASAGVQVSFWCQQELGQNDSVQIVFDTVTQANNKMYVNGVSKTLTFITTPAGSNIGGVTSRLRIGRSNASSYWNGNLGEVWIQKGAVDLATSNPFYDSSTNRHISVRQVIEDTGLNPLFALPLNASNPELNLGSKPDLYVHSGPYTGARGGSEFWARSAKFAGSSSNLTHSGALGSNTDEMTFVLFAHPNTAFVGDDSMFSMANSDALYFSGTSGSVVANFVGYQSSISTGWSLNQWNSIMISVDASASTATVCCNGVVISPSSVGFGSSFSWNSTSTSNIGFAFEGFLGNIYISNSYVDFSQETNRHKFIDQLGNPKDLTLQIEEGDIPSPMVYLEFNDTTALGTNSGSGGNYTINGTVVAGDDIDA